MSEPQSQGSEAGQNLFGQMAAGWEADAQARQLAQEREEAHARLMRPTYGNLWRPEFFELARPDIYEVKEKEWLDTQPPQERARRKRLDELSLASPEVALLEGEFPEVIFGAEGAKLCNDFLAFMRNYNYPYAVPLHGVKSVRPSLTTALGGLIGSVVAPFKEQSALSKFRSMQDLTNFIVDGYDRGYRDLVRQALPNYEKTLHSPRHPSVVKWGEFSQGYVLPVTLQHSTGLCLGVDGLIRAVTNAAQTGNVLDLSKALVVPPYIECEPRNIEEQGTYQVRMVHCTASHIVSKEPQQWGNNGTYNLVRREARQSHITPEEAVTLKKTLKWQVYDSKGTHYTFKNVTLTRQYPTVQEHMSALAKTVWEASRRS